MTLLQQEHRRIIQNMQNVLSALAKYISVLDASLSRTTYASERPLYTLHLAQAAVLFSLVQRGASPEAVREKFAEEERAFGWSYLSGSEGEKAEAAFQAVVQTIDAQYPIA